MCTHGPIHVPQTLRTKFEGMIMHPQDEGGGGVVLSPQQGFVHTLTV